jgi:hypothetical protein
MHDHLVARGSPVEEALAKKGGVYIASKALLRLPT